MGEAKFVLSEIPGSNRLLELMSSPPPRMLTQPGRWEVLTLCPLIQTDGHLTQPYPSLSI